METLKGGNNNGEAENIGLKQEESDCFIYDDNAKPESFAKKSQGSKRLKSNKKFPVKTYIYIDDDEDDDAANHSPVNLSKSKRTYPGRGPNNCHDFSKQSNGDPSADDVSKSESKVDSKGVLQKLWGRVSLKKKTSVQSESGSIEVFNEKEGQCGFGHTDEKSRETPTDNKVENERKLKSEEAQRLQRLLKRKEAEKSRLLYIRRRQIQRVKEIRETQKKEKQLMNLKETYRAKVQQDLKNLETTCHDMASLLRLLGILVNDGTYVSSNQIHAAYKRALLRFHPDRASGSDMRQQVEGEEKFKLISRMREKFLI